MTHMAIFLLGVFMGGFTGVAFMAAIVVGSERWNPTPPMHGGEK